MSGPVTQALFIKQTFKLIFYRNERRREENRPARKCVQASERRRTVRTGNVSKEKLSGSQPLVRAMGIGMAILFSAAAAYLGLKVGQVFEAAIPIAILAVGISGAAKRKNALGENVIIQSIGACSGVIVAGAIFTLPALYILQSKYPEMTVNFLQVFISSLLGGVLGILFLIPFRKYFVKDMHGKYPFPEATATTQVLISGEKGGSQAKPLLMAGLIGGLYDFIVATFGWWNENFTTRVCGWGEMLAEKAKLVFKVNTGAAVLGLGYIVGLKYAAIICFGSLSVWFIIIPGNCTHLGRPSTKHVGSEHHANRLPNES